MVSDKTPDSRPDSRSDSQPDGGPAAAADVTNDASRDGLEPGLRAAFESATGASVVDLLGLRSRVCLREPGDEITPLVDSHSPELDRASGPGGQGAGSRYQMLGEIARGGVGVVLKGRDPDLGRDVAMKVLQSRHAENPAMVQRFVEEAQIAGQLQHPGILPVYELGLNDDRRPYFTMKLVKGRTLSSLLEERRDSAADRARFLGIFEDVCQTIAYAHTRGVIHRDLKPSNIMVGPYGEVQVVDWGLAKVLGQGGVVDERRAELKEDDTVIETVRSTRPGTKSMAGSVMGTPAYMAPEQARGDIELVSERTDVFALGAILCEILTGQPPFAGRSADVLAMVAEGRLDGAYARLEACGADPELATIACACLAADARDRPPSARAVSEAVTTYLATLEERARASELAMLEAKTRAAEERRRRRLTVTLGVPVLLIVIAASVAFVKLERDKSQRQAEAVQRVSDALQNAQFHLGQAREARVGETEAWTRVTAAAEHLASQGREDLDRDTVDRVERFLDDLDAADRDRRMMVRLEEAVVFGATHFDAVSWQRMAQQLEDAFRAYGIDIVELPDDDVAARIAASGITAELANGYELWLGTCFNLLQFGDERYPEDELAAKLPVLGKADDDPFRTDVRRTYYGLAGDLRDELENVWGGEGEISPEGQAIQAEARATVLALSDQELLAESYPITISWLAVTAMIAGDLALADDIYQRALMLHPDDFLLTFDYTHYLQNAERWQEAIGYYRACLAIRPKVPGIWRSLGLAYQKHAAGAPETRDAILGQARAAIERSIELQRDHAPTHTDLGKLLVEMGDVAAAIGAFGEAARLRPDDARTHATLGRALMDAGRYAEALAAFGLAQQVGPDEQLQAELKTWMQQCVDEIPDS